MLWAVGGFLAGVPREVWLVVAIIAAVLVSLFIYRQITLGKLREQEGRNPTGREGVPAAYEETPSLQLGFPPRS